MQAFRGVLRLVGGTKVSEGLVFASCLQEVAGVSVPHTLTPLHVADSRKVAMTSFSEHFRQPCLLAGPSCLNNLSSL